MPMVLSPLRTNYQIAGVNPNFISGTILVYSSDSYALLAFAQLEPNDFLTLHHLSNGIGSMLVAPTSYRFRCV